MLLSLNIENYVLIRSCNIEFHKGLMCFTGETGAGKSIILGALSLLLGQRADTQILFDKEKKCIIEAKFSMDKTYEQIFNDNNLDFEPTSIFRREITPSGKTRAFINDTPVQLSTMRLFADILVDIHSQSSTIKLKDHAFQLSLLDSLSENKQYLVSYKQLYKDFQELKTKIENLEQEQSEYLKEKSYNEFLYNELKEANLQEDEQEEDERILELISNSEKIKENILACLQILEDDENTNIISMLNDTAQKLDRIASHNAVLASLYSRTQSAIIELNDIHDELSSFNDKIDFDDRKQEELTDRLNLIYELQRKHNVTTIAELLKIQQDLEEKIKLSDGLNDEILLLKKQQEDLFKKLENTAKELHKQRMTSAKLLEKEIKPLLSSMAMKEAILQIEVNLQQDFNSSGKDQIRFLFNANRTKDNSLQEIQHAISGGELSRLMLALKAVVANKYSIPTMIFDEIDTGISGDIASKAADIMKTIALSHQVIVITHLAQIASKADYQYKVYKQIVDNVTQSNINLLTKEQRIEEIARMLSGEEITPEAIANAKTLLQ